MCGQSWFAQEPQSLVLSVFTDTQWLNNAGEKDLGENKGVGRKRRLKKTEIDTHMGEGKEKRTRQRKLETDTESWRYKRQRKKQQQRGSGTSVCVYGGGVHSIFAHHEV